MYAPPSGTIEGDLLAVKLANGLNALPDLVASQFAEEGNSPERSLQERIQDYFRSHYIHLVEEPALHRLTVGGHDWRIEEGAEGYWMCVQSLDHQGSNALENWQGGFRLPAATSIVVFDRTDDALFENIVFAGVVELNSGILWAVTKRPDGTFDLRLRTRSKKFQKQQAGGDPNPHEPTVCLTNGDTDSFRDLVTELFRGKPAQIRDFGCPTIGAALVASGQAHAFIGDDLPSAVDAVAYALVKGAGGFVSGFSGEPLDKRLFSYAKPASIILAGSETLGLELKGRIRRAHEALSRRAAGEYHLRKQERPPRHADEGEGDSFDRKSLPR